MKRLITSFILLIVFLSISEDAKSQRVSFGVFGGMSTPNDAIANIFNKENFDLENNPLPVLYGAMDAGWHLGINSKIKLSDKAYLDASVAWHSFPEITNKAKFGEEVQLFDTKTSIIPLSLGVDYYLFENFVSIYVVGNLAYNHISTDIESAFDVIPETRDMFKERSDDRFGCGLGAGLEFDAVLLKVGIEAKYNWINLIGKVDGEETKNFMNLTLFFYL